MILINDLLAFLPDPFLYQTLILGNMACHHLLQVVFLWEFLCFFPKHFQCRCSLTGPAPFCNPQSISPCAPGEEFLHNNV